MGSFFRKIYETSPQDIYRYFANKKRHAKGRRVILNYTSNHNVKKLHIGCGGNFFDGWLNSDLVPDNKEIALLDASKPFPIPSDSFDYVYSEHVFEHLTFDQQLNYLKESLRILKPGGKIRIATPNLDFLIHLTSDEKTMTEREYLTWNCNTFLKNVQHGLKEIKDPEVYVINNYFRDWGHQLIHNKSSLFHLIEHIGFETIIFETVAHSQDAALVDLERHAAMITDTYNKLETMVIEARKPGI